MPSAPIELWAPGPVHSRTGGYLYNRRVAAASEGLITLRAVAVDALATELSAARRRGVGAVVFDSLYLQTADRLLLQWRKDRSTVRRVLLVHLFPTQDVSSAATADLRVEREICACAAGVVVPSAFMERAAAERGARRVVVAYPGTQLPRRVRPRWPMPRRGGRNLRLITVANMSPVKNLQWLIDAVLIPMGRSAWPNGSGRSMSWDWVLVGAAASHPRRSMRPDCWYGPRIRAAWVGSQSPRSTIGLIAAADLTLQPSLFESYGMAAAESLACGVPVLANEVGGTAEVVRSGTDGMLCRPNDAAQWHAALQRFAADPRLRAAWRRGAREAMFPRWSDTAATIAAFALTHL